MEIGKLDDKFRVAQVWGKKYNDQPYVDAVRWAYENDGAAIKINPDEGGKGGARIKMRLSRAASSLNYPRIQWLECDEENIRFAFFKNRKRQKTRSQREKEKAAKLAAQEGDGDEDEDEDLDVEDVEEEESELETANT